MLQKNHVSEYSFLLRQHFKKIKNNRKHKTGKGSWEWVHVVNIFVFHMSCKVLNGNSCPHETAGSFDII